MKGQASVLFQMLGGHVKLSELYSRKGLVPGEVIIQRRPRRRKGGETAGQRRVTQIGKDTARRAMEEYRDPVKRAKWEAEYERLSAICQKKNNRHVDGGETVGGYELPYRLYDFVRQQVMREAYGHGTEC